MTVYAELIPSQQEQCQHDLFHDALFSVDSHLFDYQVNANGIVTGRQVLKRKPAGKRMPVSHNQPVIIMTNIANEVEQDTYYRLEMAINDLARLVAMQLVKQTQKEIQYAA